MTPLLHNYTQKAGKTYLWDTLDNKEFYEKNLANPETNKRLHELGFVDNPIEYKFNSHGFRTAEFDQKFDMVCFGCSFTMGTGVHAKDTWPEQLQNLTGLKIANLGHAGSSNDTVFRFASHYLKWLKPRYAIWLQTDRHRVELIDESNKVSLNILASDTANPCANDYFTKTWFTSDVNQRLNLEKNTLSFQQLCLENNVTYIILDRSQVPVHDRYPLSEARDLTHPGPKAYQELSLRIKTVLENSQSSLRIGQAQTQ